MTPFHTTRRVEFVDTDLVGIVRFSTFFRYMESAEVDFLHSLGLSVKMMWRDRPLGFPGSQREFGNHLPETPVSAPSRGAKRSFENFTSPNQRN
jgi:hypothetical protein